MNSDAAQSGANAVATFIGPRGSLRISVERYEFPESADDKWDSNWLIIVGNAVLDGKNWSFRDACLTTFEIAGLAAWLELVSSGDNDQKYCAFAEPNLEFEHVSGASIRIAFDLETLPPWAKTDDDRNNIAMDIPIDAGLLAAAKSLRGLLTEFPIRGRGLG